jgi:hypothetical protein
MCFGRCLNRAFHFHVRFLSDLWIPVVFHNFVIDHAPHVSPSHLYLTLILEWVLIETASIAIWNRNKIIIFLAINITCVDLAVIIRGESFALFSSAAEWESLTRNVAWYQLSRR